MFKLEGKSMTELLAMADHDPEAQFQLGLNYANGDGVHALLDAAEQIQEDGG